MMYEDKNGRLLMPEEVEEYSPWEIDDMRIHVSETYCQTNIKIYKQKLL